MFSYKKKVLFKWINFESKGVDMHTLINENFRRDIMVHVRNMKLETGL